MSEITVTIHNYHERLLKDLRQQSAMFIADPSEKNGESLMALLCDDLQRHAQDEERELYPLIDGIVRAAGGRATATMSVDHEFIGEYVDWIGAALHSLRGATGSHRDLLLGQVHRYLVQLEAVLNIHLEKEERLFLPMIARHVSLTNQRRMMAAMHGSSAALNDALPGNGRIDRAKPARSPFRVRVARKKDVARKAGGKRTARDRNRQPRR